MPKSRAPDDPPKPDRPMTPHAYQSAAFPGPAAAAHRAPRSAVSPVLVNLRTIARQPSSALLRAQCQRITTQQPWQMLIDERFSRSQDEVRDTFTSSQLDFGQLRIGPNATAASRVRSR